VLIDRGGAQVQGEASHQGVPRVPEYGNALMKSKREANSRVVQMALRPVRSGQRECSGQSPEMKEGLLAAALFYLQTTNAVFNRPLLVLRSELSKLATY
jgi:hypothetical protein